MKISEFIGFLDKKIEEHGDIDLIFMVRDINREINEQEFHLEMDWSLGSSKLHPDLKDPDTLSLNLY